MKIYKNPYELLRGERKNLARYGIKIQTFGNIVKRLKKNKSGREYASRLRTLNYASTLYTFVKEVYGENYGRSMLTKLAYAPLEDFKKIEKEILASFSKDIKAGKIKNNFFIGEKK